MESPALGLVGLARTAPGRSAYSGERTGSGCRPPAEQAVKCSVAAGPAEQAPKAPDSLRFGPAQSGSKLVAAKG